MFKGSERYAEPQSTTADVRPGDVRTAPAGEAGLNVPFGAHLIIAGAVERWIPIEGYWREEMNLIQRAAEDIQAKLTRWLALP